MLTGFISGIGGSSKCIEFVLAVFHLGKAWRFLHYSRISVFFLVIFSFPKAVGKKKEKKMAAISRVMLLVLPTSFPVFQVGVFVIGFVWKKCGVSFSLRVRNPALSA